jgi:hypothetical protein
MLCHQGTPPKRIWSASLSLSNRRMRGRPSDRQWHSHSTGHPPGNDRGRLRYVRYMMPEIVLDRPNRVEQSGRRLVAVLWRGWLVVACIALVVAVGAYTYAKWQPVVYKASGRMFLNGNVADGQDPVRLVDTQAQLAVSTPVLVEISKRLSLPVEVVQQHLTVIPDEKGDFFTIDGTGATSAEAARLVMAAQLAYQQVVSGQGERNRKAVLNNFVEERADLERSYAEAHARAAEAPTDARLQARVDILAEQLKALRQRIGDSVATQPAVSPVQLAETPQVPTAPAAPKPLWFAVAGGLLGAILGVALVWWRSERVTVAMAKEPSERPTQVAAEAQSGLAAGSDEASGRPNLSRSSRPERQRAALAAQRGGAAMAAASELDGPSNAPTTPPLSPAAPWEPAGRSDNGSGSATPPPEPRMHKARRVFNPPRSTQARSPGAGEAEARGEAAGIGSPAGAAVENSGVARLEGAPDAYGGATGAPTLTPELFVAFNRLTDPLQEVMERLRLDGWGVAEQSLPQVEAEKAALYFGLEVVVILLDDGTGKLEVAGEVGVTPIERRKAIRYDPDLWRAVLDAGPRVMDEEDRARFVEAGIPGSAGEAILMIPLVHEDVGFGLLLASAHTDGEESAAFHEWNIGSMAAYTRVLEPALWSWVLLGRLKLRLSDER